jgi:hypothetical protein
MAEENGGRFSGISTTDPSMHRRAPKPPADDQPAGPHAWQSIRKSKVTRARELVKEKGYPSKEVLESVAKLLARHLKEG